MAPVFMALFLAGLVVVWAALQTYNEKDRRRTASPPAATDEICREVTVVRLWAKPQPDGTPCYYGAFASRGEGRYELQLPAETYHAIAAGDTGDLVLKNGSFVRFTQTF